MRSLVVEVVIVLISIFLLYTKLTIASIQIVPAILIITSVSMKQPYLPSDPLNVDDLGIGKHQRHLLYGNEAQVKTETALF